MIQGLKCSKLFIFVALVGFITNCGDIVVKVKKKPREVDSSAVAAEESEDSLGLYNSPSFLNGLDGLKSIAVEKLIEELSGPKYREKFRSGVRHYRELLINQAANPGSYSNSLFDGDKDCRDLELSLNIEDSDEYLGMILQVAFLASLSEAGAQALNSGLAKEIAAITQLVLNDLGVKVDGESSVEEADGETTTKGTFTFSLSPDSDEDPELQARDEAEILTMTFERVLTDSEKHLGTFHADVTIGHLLADGSTETLAATVDLDREIVEDLWVHEASIELGIAGSPASYSHNATFEQIDGNVVKVTDVITEGETETIYVSNVDLEEKTQCKVDHQVNDLSDDEDKTVDDDNLDDGSVPTDLDDDSSKDDGIVDPLKDDPDLDDPGQNPSQSSDSSKTE